MPHQVIPRHHGFLMRGRSSSSNLIMVFQAYILDGFLCVERKQANAISRELDFANIHIRPCVLPQNTGQKA